MIAYFSAVIINFGDFSRFSRTERGMKIGNFTGLPVSLAFFTFLALFITAGAYVVYQDGQGDPLTNPAEIIEQVGSPALTIVAALTFPRWSQVGIGPGADDACCPCGLVLAGEQMFGALERDETSRVSRSAEDVTRVLDADGVVGG